MGLEECREWVLLRQGDGEEPMWLQSVERPELALAVVRPRRFVPDYRVRLPRSELVLVGLSLLDVIRMPWSAPGGASTERKGPAAAFTLGLVFGVGIGPCTFAFMAPMLAVTLRTAGTNPLYGAALLVAYGLGHSAIMVLAGTFTEVVQRYLNWSSRSRGTGSSLGATDT